MLYDAVYVAGGEGSANKLKQDTDAVRFVNEAFRHCKPIAASGAGVEVLKAAAYPGADRHSERRRRSNQPRRAGGRAWSTQFIAAIAQHRFWNRELAAMPA